METKDPKIEVSEKEVVDFLRIQGIYNTALQDVIRRKITVQAARAKGIHVTQDEIQKAFEVYRIANGLHKSRDTEEWLESHGVTIEVLAETIETNLMTQRFRDMLAKEADNMKLLKNPEIAVLLQERVYEEWLAKAMK